VLHQIRAYRTDIRAPFGPYFYTTHSQSLVHFTAKNHQRLWYDGSHTRIERKHGTIEPLFAPNDQERYAQDFRDLGTIEWYTHCTSGYCECMDIRWDCFYGHG
jgi:hypothetical protein